MRNEKEKMIRFHFLHLMLLHICICLAMAYLMPAIITVEITSLPHWNSRLDRGDLYPQRTAVRIWLDIPNDLVFFFRREKSSFSNNVANEKENKRMIRWCPVTHRTFISFFLSLSHRKCQPGLLLLLSIYVCTRIPWYLILARASLSVSIDHFFDWTHSPLFFFDFLLIESAEKTVGRGYHAEPLFCISRRVIRCSFTEVAFMNDYKPNKLLLIFFVHTLVLCLYLHKSPSVHLFSSSRTFVWEERREKEKEETHSKEMLRWLSVIVIRCVFRLADLYSRSVLNILDWFFFLSPSIMTQPKKELTVACSYLLRLMKAHVQLSPEQINLFKRAFHDILTKRYVGHWFPGKDWWQSSENDHRILLLSAAPHRGSAFRCLQTKNWKDAVLRSIAQRCSLPIHRYLPAIFTIWIGKDFQSLSSPRLCFV